MGELASTRGWGPGWPNCPRSMIKVVTWTQPYGTRLSLPVHKAMTVLIPTLVNRLATAAGHDFPQYGSYGFACRAIRGSDPPVPSNHSWGLGTDLDAPHNGLGLYGYGTMPRNAGAIARGLSFRWGGHASVGGGYSARPDPMHFEYMGTPAQAAAMTKQLLAAEQPEDDVQLTDTINLGTKDKPNVVTVAQLLGRTYTSSLTTAARLAALETAVANDPDSPVTQDMLNEAVAKGLAGAQITVTPAGAE